MKVKICGINSLEDALLAIDCGADALGFLVGITHLAEDKVSSEEANNIIKKIPPFVNRVAVTHLTDADSVVKLLGTLQVDTLQLHDKISIEDIIKIREAQSHLKIIKSVSVVDSSSIEYAQTFCGGAVDALLLDSRTELRLGGTGITHDWNISREIVDKVNLPVILAGGLNPLNLEEAIKKVRPYAVDVNSGVELNSLKDRDRLTEFINIVRKF